MLAYYTLLKDQGHYGFAESSNPGARTSIYHSYDYDLQSMQGPFAMLQDTGGLEEREMRIAW